MADTRFYSVPEAAQYLGVNRSTVWRWIEADQLRAYRVGPKKIRIRREDLDQMIQPAKSEGTKERATNEVEPVPAALSIQPLSQQQRQHASQAMEKARQLRRRILARRAGKPLPSSWRLIREAREERSRRL